MPHTPPQAIPASGVRPDRRAHRRAKLGSPVLLETSEASRPALGLDVSGGGVAVRTELELALGQDVGVYLELPIGYAVETRARVVRVDERGVALRFLDLPREAEVALRSFCRISGLHRAEKP